MPNWEDVRWSQADAEGAAGALQRTADALEGAAEERAQAGLGAQAEWRGAHQLLFAARLRQALDELHELAGRCRRAAAQIGAASAQAREEQARREREREEWEREERERRERERRRDAAPSGTPQ